MDSYRFVAFPKRCVTDDSPYVLEQMETTLMTAGQSNDHATASVKLTIVGVTFQL